MPTNPRHDAGGRQVVYLDQTGQSWSTILDQYNTAGNLFAETTYYDAGGRQVLYLDQTNQSWATIADSYDAQNRLASEFTTFDNGTHTQSIFDVTNTHTWKQDVLVYDAAYNVTQHYQILYDNSVIYL